VKTLQREASRRHSQHGEERKRGEQKGKGNDMVELPWKMYLSPKKNRNETLDRENKHKWSGQQRFRNAVQKKKDLAACRAGSTAVWMFLCLSHAWPIGSQRSGSNWNDRTKLVWV